METLRVQRENRVASWWRELRLIVPNTNKQVCERVEVRPGCSNSTIVLPEEEQGQQRGGKRQRRMSGIRVMLRALKKGAAVAATSPSPIVDAHRATSELSSRVLVLNRCGPRRNRKCACLKGKPCIVLCSKTIDVVIDSSIHKLDADRTDKIHLSHRRIQQSASSVNAWTIK
jgi:hypothetical protein